MKKEVYIFVLALIMTIGIGCGASEERVYEVVVNEDIVDVNIANEISNESNFDEPSVYEETSAIPQELMESFDVNENFGPTTSHYIVVESKTTGCCYKVIWYNEDGEPEPSREEVQMGTIPCTDKGFYGSSYGYGNDLEIIDTFEIKTIYIISIDEFDSVDSCCRKYVCENSYFLEEYDEYSMDVSADSYRFLIQKHSEAVNGVYKFITYAAPLHEEERGDGAVIEVEETAYYSW